jgi:hypothetical protein
MNLSDLKRLWNSKYLTEYIKISLCVAILYSSIILSVFISELTIDYLTPVNIFILFTLYILIVGFTYFKMNKHISLGLVIVLSIFSKYTMGIDLTMILVGFITTLYIMGERRTTDDGLVLLSIFTGQILSFVPILGLIVFKACCS